MKIFTPIIMLALVSTMVFAQSNVTQTLANMSNTHISEIAAGNINPILNSYVSSPFIFINMNYTNFSNTYSGQSGIIAALTNMTSFYPPYTFYIKNSSVVEINTTEYSVNRDVWFISSNQAYTLMIPYSATYTYTNGSWLIDAEWFGTNADAGVLTSGNQVPANFTTTTIPANVSTISTTTITNTTTLQYTIPGQSGQNATQNSTAAVNVQNQQPNLLILIAFILVVAIVVLYILTMRKKA